MPSLDRITDEQKHACVKAMVDAMGDHEFYCSNYAAKEQPHIEGLLQTLGDSVRVLELDIAREREAGGEPLDAREHTRRLLHRLLSATNRRMHKGYPEMLSYLMGKPSEYCSHEFAALSFNGLLKNTLYKFQLQLTGAHSSTCPEAPPTADEAAKTTKDAAIPLHSKAKPKLIVSDYDWRPLELEAFPLYFFMSACDASTHCDSTTLPWMLGYAPCSKDVLSKRYHGVQLRDPSTGEVLVESGYYVQLRTQVCWKVPVLYGRIPAGVASDSCPSDKGLYALFVMLLFRPFRNVVDLFPVRETHTDAELPDSAWMALFTEYQRWRDVEVDSVAQPYLNRSAAHPMGTPEFGSKDWWACMVALRLRNLELTMTKHGGAEFQQPSDCSHLPSTVGPDKDAVMTTTRHKDAELVDGLEGRLPSEPGSPPRGVGSDYDVDEVSAKVDVGKFPPVESQRCGELPGTMTLLSFHSIHPTRTARSLEKQYAFGYSVAAQQVFGSSEIDASSQPELAPPDTLHFGSSAEAAAAAAASQQEYFKDLDGYKADPDKSAASSSVRSSNATISDIKKRAVAVLTQQARPSETSTAVLEAAVFLLQKGVVDVPAVGGVNVKQARTLLWWAAWLQYHMHTRWYDEGILPEGPPGGSCRLFHDFQLALIGPGGTGKTTVLLLVEALIEFFVGHETVHKCALSNTAARLLGGDTLHALCKLPRLDLQSRRGKLTGTVLKQHRQRWRDAVAMFLDEISMVAPEQLIQADIRVRQAKEQPLHRFGGLGVSLSGDFLQLPPVDTHSLAQPVDDLGKWVDTSCHGRADATSLHQTAAEDEGGHGDGQATQRA